MSSESQSHLSPLSSSLFPILSPCPDLSNKILALYFIVQVPQSSRNITIGCHMGFGIFQKLYLKDFVHISSL